MLQKQEIYVPNKSELGRRDGWCLDVPLCRLASGEPLASPLRLAGGAVASPVTEPTWGRLSVNDEMSIEGTPV